LAISGHGLQAVSAKGTYLKENTIVSAEFNLYRTNDETLLWSGETDTVYSENFENLPKSTPTRLSNS
jgi:hypothetical protein